jgi:hypothetical protein
VVDLEEDVLLLFAAYVTLAVSASAAHSHLRVALFGAGAALLLLFIGIHNAWDAVTYHVFVKKPGNESIFEHAADIGNTTFEVVPESRATGVAQGAANAHPLICGMLIDPPCRYGPLPPLGKSGYRRVDRTRSFQKYSRSFA